MKKIKIQYVFALFVFFLVLIFYGMLAYNSRDYNDYERLECVEFEGTYYAGDGTTVITNGDGTGIDGSVEHEIIARGHFVNDIPENLLINMYFYRVKLKIVQNGKVIFNYGEAKEHPKFMKSIGVEWRSFHSPGISKTDNIEITISNVYEDSYSGVYDSFFQQIYVGDRSALMHQNISKKMPQILIDILIIIMGLLMICVIVTFKFSNVNISNSYFACAFLIISGACCGFIDHSYVTLLFDNAVFVNIIDVLLEIAILVFFLYYFEMFIKDKVMRKFFTVMSRGWLVAILLFIVLQFTGPYDGIELTVPYMFVVMVTMVIGIVIFIIDSLRYPDRQKKIIIYSSTAMGIMTMAEVAHYYLTQSYWIWCFLIGLFVFAVAQFIVLASYAYESMVKAQYAQNIEKELVENRLLVVLSQIQPHFLYNALNTIQYLCDTKPEIAGRVVENFADYLRGNMDALTIKDTIPFVQEMEHLENYLAIEMLRFEEIEVRYHLEVEEFKLPALTIQPMVENAIRYGVRQNEDGGIIVIETAEDENNIYINIIDDGEGFDPTAVKEDGRSHLGITNTRSRIEQMCRGTLEIESEIGKGTKVKIVIPK